jgi:hypothetical protein
VENSTNATALNVTELVNVGLETRVQRAVQNLTKGSYYYAKVMYDLVMRKSSHIKRPGDMRQYAYVLRILAYKLVI